MKRILCTVLGLLLAFIISVSGFAEGDVWTCSNGHENSSENLFCGKCGEKQPSEDDSWTCGNGHENPTEHNFCSVCGEKKPVSSDGEAFEQAWKEPYENKEYETALPLLREAAENGDVEAKAALAMCCIYGNGMENDYSQGFKLAQEAADAGNARGMFLIGRCYSNGDSVTQDFAKALEWFQKAIDLGDEYAMNALGLAYKLGEGVNQDYAKALEWFQKAADLGQIFALNNIGVMYENGEGVTQDYAKAMEWYRKAADLGYAVAMRNIGWLYCNGRGVDRNYQTGLEWYQKAADLDATNSEEAYKKLVDAYNDESYLLSYSYYEKAKSHENADKYANLLKARLCYNLQLGESELKELSDAILKDIDFADSKTVLVCNVAITQAYLKGYWRTANGMHGLEVKEDGYMTTTVPAIPRAGDYYTIIDGIDYDYYDGKWDDRVAQYKFTPISKDQMEMYSYQVKQSYTFNRIR